MFKTQPGYGYPLSALADYAATQMFTMAFYGRDIYNEGQPSQFLALTSEEDEREETYVWHSHVKHNGGQGIYLRTT